MNKKSEEILEIIKDYKSKSNDDLRRGMEYINEDFELTKNNVINMTHHLDEFVSTYNKILSEYKIRKGIK